MNDKYQACPPTFPLKLDVSSLFPQPRVHGVMWDGLLWSHSSPRLQWRPLCPLIWLQPSQCQAVGRLVRVSPASTHDPDPEAPTEWRLVTTVEITFITLVGQQNRAVVWGNERWLFRGGDWWRNWALFGYWFIGPVSWAAVYSCQLGSPGHPLLATLAMPGQGWVPAAACQIWQTCSSTKHRILKMTTTKISGSIHPWTVRLVINYVII